MALMVHDPVEPATRRRSWTSRPRPRAVVAVYARIASGAIGGGRTCDDIGDTQNSGVAGAGV